MFNNPGSKLQTAAVTIFGISLVVGILMMIIGLFNGRGMMILSGILLLVGCYLTGLVYTGLGSLVDDIQDLKRILINWSQTSEAEHATICSYCGTKNEAEGKFCTNCGLGLNNSTEILTCPCPECGAENDAKGKYCKECGTLLKKEK